MGQYVITCVYASAISMRYAKQQSMGTELYHDGCDSQPTLLSAFVPFGRPFVQHSLGWDMQRSRMSSVMH